MSTPEDINHSRLVKLTALQQTIEQYRREPKTMGTEPINAAVPDYANSAGLVSQAMHHLDEALPTGQKRRAELAHRMLTQGVQELSMWMRAKGYDV